MGFVRRQAITAALTANAIRPLPGFRAGIPAFFAGWLTGELAPHVLGLTAADAAAHLTGSRRDWRGLAALVYGLPTAFKTAHWVAPFVFARKKPFFYGKNLLSGTGSASP